MISSSLCRYVASDVSYAFGVGAEGMCLVLHAVKRDRKLSLCFQALLTLKFHYLASTVDLGHGRAREVPVVRSGVLSGRGRVHACLRHHQPQGKGGGEGRRAGGK